MLQVGLANANSDFSFSVRGFLDAVPGSRQLAMKAQRKTIGQRGVAAIELAIVLPVLILLAVGAAEFGIMMYNKHVLVNASREAARAGTTREDLYDDNAEISQLVTDYCEDRMIRFGSDVDPQTSLLYGLPASLGFQDNFGVRVTYEYEFLVASLFGFGPTKTLSATAVMKMEAPPPAGP
jgi:Flp pilus assembly protein TadG